MENKISNENDIFFIVEKKIIFFQDAIQKTYIHLNRNKLFGILTTNEVNTCILSLKILSDTLKSMYEKINVTDKESTIQKMQIINNDLSGILKKYGTQQLEDLISICCGSHSNSITYNSEYDKNKYDLLKKYFHPTNYKLMNQTNKKVKKENFEKIPIHFECHDISIFANDFHTKVFGINLHLLNEEQNKDITVSGILDDVVLDFIHDKYISFVKKELLKNLPSTPEFQKDLFCKFMNFLSLKDYLIYDCKEIYQKYIGSLSQYKLLKQKALQQIIKDFISHDLFSKRNMILLLLIHTCDSSSNGTTNSESLLNNEGFNTNSEDKYIAYLLYDLLSNENSGSVDSREQVILLDSLPYHGKEGFHDAMKKTVQYTQELTNFDMNKIPLEQQICLLKVNDTVKEKAIVKLKEVKSKTDDTGSKARQYLDGLLKIPFQIYKKEPILYVMNETRELFKEIVEQFVSLVSSNIHSPNFNTLYLNDVFCIPTKLKYTNMEIKYYLEKIKEIIQSYEKKILRN